MEYMQSMWWHTQSETGLSTRAVHCLDNLYLKSKDDVIHAIQMGRIWPGVLRCCGNKTRDEIYAYCGVLVPDSKPERRYE